jgi:hypothetical protein
MKRQRPSSFLLPFLVALLLFQSVVVRTGAALKIEAECSACRAVAVSSSCVCFFLNRDNRKFTPRGHFSFSLSLSLSARCDEIPSLKPIPPFSSSF